MADQTILQETLDNNIVDGDWLIYWKTSTGVQRRVARSSLLGATLTGAGTIATGGFTLTVPATGTAALRAGTPVAGNVAQWDDANTVEDAGFAASNVALLDGSRSLTADWDIGDNRRVKADGVRARDGAGLRLEDDAGNLGVFVEDGGEVGIGNSAPSSLLTVGSVGDNSTSNAIALVGGNLGNNEIKFFGGGNSTTKEVAAIRATAGGSYAESGVLIFRTASNDGSNNLTLAEQMRITDTGLVGIGNSAPSSLLTVGSVGSLSTSNAIALVGGNTGNNEIKFFGGGNSTTKEVATIRATAGGSYAESGVLIFRTASNDGSNNLTLAEQMRITDTGLVGIGTSTPSEELHVVGDVRISNLTSGTVYSDANGVLNNSASDARMKTDVEPIGAADALAMVDALRPVRYRWNEKHAPSLGEQVEVGLIAQEVLAHVPEVIGTNRDGMLSLEYARLTALLIGAVQALTARVEALEAAAAA